jgi:hypothetical protein
MPPSVHLPHAIQVTPADNLFQCNNKQRQKATPKIGEYIPVVAQRTDGLDCELPPKQHPYAISDSAGDHLDLPCLVAISSTTHPSLTRHPPDTRQTPTKHPTHSAGTFSLSLHRTMV